MEFATQIFSWLSWIIDKINQVVFWLAEALSDKLGLEINNMYLILLVVLSLGITSKITEDRGLKLAVIAVFVFAAFFNSSGVVI